MTQRERDELTAAARAAFAKADGLIDRIGPGECWIWRGRRVGDYTRPIKSQATRERAILNFTWEGRKIDSAARVAGFAFLNLAARLDDKPPIRVLHNCDNEACVNPGHMRLGTMRENMRDRWERGRYGSQRTKMGRLSAEQVAEARRLYAGGMYQSAIGKKFGVSQSTISQLLGPSAVKSEFPRCRTCATCLLPAEGRDGAARCPGCGRLYSRAVLAVALWLKLTFRSHLSAGFH